MKTATYSPQAWPIEMLAKKLTAALALALSLLLLAVIACTSEYEGSGSPVNQPLGPRGTPDPVLVQALQSLPMFPDADPASLVDGEYRVAGPPGTGLILTGFRVLPTTTAEDVTSFFAEELPRDGWNEERPPWTNAAEKEGSVASTTKYSFLKDRIRLLFQIPLDPPKGETPTVGGVSYVSLIVAPDDVDLDPAPVGAPIDSTPPPSPPQMTPAYTAGPVPSHVPTPVTPTP